MSAAFDEEVMRKLTELEDVLSRVCVRVSGLEKREEEKLAEINEHDDRLDEHGEKIDELVVDVESIQQTLKANDVVMRENRAAIDRVFAISTSALANQERMLKTQGELRQDIVIERTHQERRDSTIYGQLSAVHNQLQTIVELVLGKTVITADILKDGKAT